MLWIDTHIKSIASRLCPHHLPYVKTSKIFLDSGDSSLGTEIDLKILEEDYILSLYKSLNYKFYFL